MLNFLLEYFSKFIFIIGVEKKLLGCNNYKEVCMKNYLIVLGIIIVLSMSSSVFSQGFTFHGTFAFPQTDFKNDKVGDDGAGFANIGFGGGLEFLSAEMGKKLYWIGSLNFVHHSVGEDLFEKFDAFDTYVNADKADVELEAFNCIAFTTGVRFRNMFDRKKKEFGMYLDGQIGMSMIYAPDYKYVSSVDGSIDERIKWDLSNSFVFSFGAGLVMWSKVLIGVKYVNMLTPEFEGQLESNDTSGLLTEKDVKFKQSVSTISINLGLTFQ